MFVVSSVQGIKHRAGANRRKVTCHSVSPLATVARHPSPHSSGAMAPAPFLFGKCQGGNVAAQGPLSPFLRKPSPKDLKGPDLDAEHQSLRVTLAKKEP